MGTIDDAKGTDNGRFRMRSRTPGANNLNQTIDVGDYNRHG